MSDTARFRAVATAAVVCAVAAAGCGSSSSKTSGAAATTSGSSGAGAATGSVIKVASAVPTSGPAFKEPEYAAGMQAAADATNAAGGIKGHKIALTVCDTTFTANGEITCARKIVASHPDVLVGPFFVADSSGASWPIFRQAGLPAIGEQGGTPTEMNSPNAFLLGSGFVGPFVGTAAAVQHAGAKNIAIITDNPNPAGPIIASLITGALKARGITSVKSVIGYTASDPTFSTAAAQATSGGVDGVILNGSPNDIAAMVKAVRATGFKGTIATPALLLPAPTITALGSLANGIILSSANAPISDTSNPGIAKFLSEMKQYEPSATLDDAAVQGWSAMELFTQAALLSNSFTPAGLMTTFNSISKPIDIGTSGPWSVVGKLGTVKGFSRIVNPTVTLSVVKDGKVVPGSGGFINPLAP